VADCRASRGLERESQDCVSTQRLVFRVRVHACTKKGFLIIESGAAGAGAAAQAASSPPPH